tara:strand:+ start:174 stop:686 length:513 start_codon:yes stop_codon:yes gene_type:complete
MNFKIIYIFFFLVFLGLTNGAIADTNELEKEEELLQKAKEINKKVKLKAASEQSAISDEEPLPLNDPFVGDASISGGKTQIVLVGSEEEKDERSLYNFKLIAVMSGKYESYISLVNSSGDIIHLQMHQELSEGIKLVALSQEEAVFQKIENDTYLTINFDNQIKETKEID